MNFLGYSESYMANMQCDYTIQVARGSTISLTITDLDMEITSDCSFDYISVSFISSSISTGFFLQICSVFSATLDL